MQQIGNPSPKMDNLTDQMGDLIGQIANSPSPVDIMTNRIGNAATQIDPMNRPIGNAMVDAPGNDENAAGHRQRNEATSCGGHPRRNSPRPGKAHEHPHF
jgi:hypothetical protein